MARLDVLIPHYDDVAGLALSLASVKDQTWNGDVRLVVADDGSPDTARHDLRALLEGQPHAAIMIENRGNRGRPYTRNVLLDAIDSPYAAWLDAGDAWYPDKIAAQFAAIEALEAGDQPEPFWITCHYDWRWTGARARRIAQETDQDQVRALLVGKNLRAYLWTLLAPSKAFRDVGWFDEKLPRLQDVDFFVRFVLKGGRLHQSGRKEALCVYNKSDIGRSADEVRACNAYLFDKHRVLYNRYGAAFRRAQLYRMEMLSARFAAKNGDHEKRRHYMWRAFTARPLKLLGHVIRRGTRV